MQDEAGDGRRLPLADELRLAAASVAQVLAGHRLPATVGGVRTPPASSSAVRDMAYRAIRDLGRLRALLGRINRRTPDDPVLSLQIVALSQLLDDSRRAPATVVDQAVRAAGADAATRNAGGLINAVLRRFLRERDALLAAVGDEPQARWNFPPWWIEQLGREQPAHWQQVLSLAQQPPPLTLRVNVRRTTVDDYHARLRAHGHDATRIGPVALRLQRPVPVDRLPDFEAGHVSVQDAGAQLAARLLPVPAGARVLDACAAPGGKSAHLLESHDIELTCLDRDAPRLARLNDDMARLGLRPARVLAGDAAEPSGWFDGRPFDAILADVPCSASGIVRRHPEIRWLRRRRDLATFAALQAQIIDGLWPTLRPGGKLLYATCSVFAAEGPDVVSAFLHRQPAARRLPLAAELGAAVQSIDQLLPFSSATREHDGFFYALIEKLR